MNPAQYWIEKLMLQRHPEGGWFKEVYCSEEIIPKKLLGESFSGERAVSTGIYYLIT